MDFDLIGRSGTAPTDDSPGRTGVAGNQSRSRDRVRLGPLAATMMAAVGLLVAVGLEQGWPRFLAGNPPSVTNDEAADIFLTWLMRPSVQMRLKEQRRLTGSSEKNQMIISDELAGIRSHALYGRIKDVVVAHLRAEHYDRVELDTRVDPSNPELAEEAEMALYTVTRSIRASFSVTTQRMADFLDAHQRVFGHEVRKRQGSNLYDTTLASVIRILVEFPDNLDANTLTFTERTPDKIDLRLRGVGP